MDWSSVDWASVTSTLVGVVIGGVLTLVGSIFASARDVRRQRRQRIYDELMPELDKFQQWGNEERLQAWDYNDEVWPWLTALRRSVALTGPTERRKVRRIYDLYREYLRR
jgi:hypothetical protein